MQYRHATFLLFVIFIGTGMLTVAVFQRRAALEEAEEMSASAIRRAQQDEASLPALFGNQYRELSMDINGDDVADSIALTFEMNEKNGTTRTLQVNQASAAMVSENPQMYFGIVDLDITDGVREIAISAIGPSDDPMTEFYRFDGATLVRIGSLQGLYESMTFDGAGTLTTQARASMLDTWFFEEQYALDPSGMLVRVDRDFYERLGGDNDITAMASVEFDTSPTNPIPVFSVTAGDTLRIVGCDNIAWCKVTNATGAEGWFHVETIAWETLMTGWSFTK